MSDKQVSIGAPAAIAIHNVGDWKAWTDREKAVFQMKTAELCMPFEVFHEALENTLERPVFTHELATNFDGLWSELFNNGVSPSLAQIVDMIPEDKRTMIVL